MQHNILASQTEDSFKVISYCILLDLHSLVFMRIFSIYFYFIYFVYHFCYFQGYYFRKNDNYYYIISFYLNFFVGPILFEFF